MHGEIVFKSHILARWLNYVIKYTKKIIYIIMYKNIPVIYKVALWIKKPQNIIAKSTSKKATQGVFSNHKLKKQGSKLNILCLSLRSLQHKLTLKKKCTLLVHNFT